jgi:hypothetical protein
MREDTLRDEWFKVSVSFDERRGYVALVPDLAEPITALSLAVLRRLMDDWARYCSSPAASKGEVVTLRDAS